VRVQRLCRSADATLWRSASRGYIRRPHRTVTSVTGSVAGVSVERAIMICFTGESAFYSGSFEKTAFESFNSVAISTLAIPLGLQAQEGGVQADGWQAHLDRDGEISGVLNFRTMGAGLHASTTGRGAATSWRPADTHSGNYSIRATFTQTAPSSHPNAYGLIFGGSDLSGADRITPTSSFARMGSETPDVTPWTAHGAIQALDADGRSTNSVTIEVGASQVRFLANDIEVSSQPRSSFNTGGIVGLRVNHELDIHIVNIHLGM
jgi:hypothetical protein